MLKSRWSSDKRKKKSQDAQFAQFAWDGPENMMQIGEM